MFAFVYHVTKLLLSSKKQYVVPVLLFRWLHFILLTDACQRLVGVQQHRLFLLLKTHQPWDGQDLKSTKCCMLLSWARILASDRFKTLEKPQRELRCVSKHLTRRTPLKRCFMASFRFFTGECLEAQVNAPEKTSLVLHNPIERN